MKKDKITKEGVVVEKLPNTLFRVKLDDGETINAFLSGKMRVNFIRILAGDRVVIEFSPYDMTKGRIIFRK